MQFSKILQIYSTEFKLNLKWIMWWVFGISAYVLLAVLMYPGEDGLRKILGLIDDPRFQAFIGDIGGKNPTYSLWIALLLPFLSLVVFAFALIAGGHIINKPLSDMTGELIHSLPLQRYEFFIARWLIGITSGLILFVVMDIFLSIPFYGVSLDLQKLFEISWWGLLYFTLGINIGMTIGCITGAGSRTALNNFLFLAISYGVQTVSKFFQDIDVLSNIAPTSWYVPEQILLNNGVENTDISLIVIFALIFFALALVAFLRRDLIPNTSMYSSLIHLPSFRRRSDKPISQANRKNVRDSIFVIWVRPFESKFPFLADFVYSERKLLFIIFWVVILFYPLQLIVYDPSDIEFTNTLQESIAAFESNRLFQIFTYGHTISNDLWLWLLITQSIGNHYFIFAPLAAHWIKKVLRSDPENQTGEIIGAFPVSPKRVLIERLCAIFLEFIFISFQMVLWVLLVRVICGVSDGNALWESVAIMAVVPLYVFIVTAGVSLGLLFKKGITLARLGILIFIFMFIAYFVVDDFPTAGLFGLYDPVQIIQQQSFFVNNAGVILLSALALLSSVSVYLLSYHYRWLDIK